MNKIENLEQLEKGNIILMFSADWCGDCIAINQFIDHIIKLYEGKWEFIYVDIDEHPDLAKHYEILGIPSFIALKEGKKVSDFISPYAKSFEEIVSFIEEIK